MDVLLPVCGALGGFLHKGVLSVTQLTIYGNDVHQRASVKSVTDVMFTECFMGTWYILNFGKSWHLGLAFFVGTCRFRSEYFGRVLTIEDVWRLAYSF